MKRLVQVAIWAFAVGSWTGVGVWWAVGLGDLPDRGPAWVRCMYAPRGTRC